MKRKFSLLLLLLLLSLFMIPCVVFASGSASGSAPGSVENGNNVTFKVSVSNTAAWNLKLSGSGATSGCSQSFADVTSNGNNTSKSFSVTCRATSVGTITFTAKGDITSADGSNSNVSIVKTVNVVKPREKEKESRLSSLSIAGYDIKFNKDNQNYSISVEPTVNSINISAKAMSNRASISGTGSKEIDLDGGIFEITCTAENGTKKTYTINVMVIDKNPINIKIDGIDYTVVKSTKQLVAPTNSVEGKITIKEMEIPSYTNDKTKLTIVGIKNAEGNIYYATYDADTYNLYNENKSSELLLFIGSKELEGYEATTLNINKKNYSAYKLNERFAIVYAIDLNSGESGYYKYDKKDNTFQYFEIDEESSGINILLITTISLGIISLGSIGYILYTFFIKKKKNKTN